MVLDQALEDNACFMHLVIHHLTDIKTNDF